MGHRALIGALKTTVVLALALAFAGLAVVAWCYGLTSSADKKL